MNILEIKDLSKSYGSKAVLRGLNFSMEQGDVVGLVGENGAGKSTLMRCATGLLHYSGTVSICGHDVATERSEALRNVGYLPENNPLYNDMYIAEYLREAGSFYGIVRGDAKARAEELIERLSLTEYVRQRISALSKGTRQRVGLAACLMHRPPLLILDEPTTGLDPRQLEDFHRLINDIKGECGILLSTHIMQEVSAVCSRVALLSDATLKETTADDVIRRWK